MPEAIVKYAINSTLGTPAFQPLDKMKQICPSDDLLFDVVSGSAVTLNGDMPREFSFVSDFSGILRVVGQIQPEYEPSVDIAISVDGVFFFSQTNHMQSTSLYCDVKVNKGSKVRIHFGGDVVVSRLSVCGRIEDTPRVYPESFWQDGIYYTKKGYEYESGGNGSVPNTVFVPSHMNGLPITTIKNLTGADFTYIVLPCTINKIENYAFATCSSLQSIFLPKSIKVIGNESFASTPMLAEINVEWGEGEVEGAPWGASNATIRYNQTR